MIKIFMIFGTFLFGLMLIMFLLGDLEMTITHNNTVHKYEFNGVVWVLLDRYSIKKYHSTDIPKKIFIYTKTKTNI